MALLNELVRTAPLVHPGPGWWNRFSRVKYCLRGLAYASQTQALFRSLKTPELALAAARYPRILSKLQRPYLNRKLRPRQRLSALQHHYRFVSRNFSDAMMTEVFSRGGFLLTELELGTAGRIGLRLSYRDEFEKEGDLSLCLVDENWRATIFVLTFTVCASGAGRNEIFVGGLQGGKMANEKERIVMLTRAMHGLRPKALLLFALQQLADIWPIATIRAVSNATHIYRHYRKRKLFAASYDEFWTESGGQADGDGMFTLPLMAAPRLAEEIKSGKRAMYRRRYTMLSDLANQMRTRLEYEALSPACHEPADPKDLPKPPSLLRPVKPASEWYI